MSISLALIPTALLLKVILFEKDYKILTQETECIDNIELPTNFVDKNLLMKTLNEYGAKIIYENDSNIKCNIDNSILEFRKQDDAYMVNISTTSDGEKVLKQLKYLDSEYRMNLQEQVYINIKNNIEEDGMEIEKEEVLEDNSIVLTISC